MFASEANPLTSEVQAHTATLPERAVPLVIGVTGHRDPAIADEPTLRARFVEILERCRSRYPSTPLVVLSGMAAGADSLAAEEAFARDVPVIACLASPLQRFEEDFPESERPALHRRLAKCARVDELTDGSDKHGGFLAVGSFLNRYSHILVAFWDGLPSSRPGGTATVVVSRLTGTHLTQLEALAAPVAPDVGPVIHIVTAREGAPRPARANEMIDALPDMSITKGDALRDVEAALKSLDRFNADIGKQRQRSVELAPGLGSLRRWTADCARDLQTTTNRYLAVLYVLGGATALLTVLAVESWRVVAIAVAFGVYRFAAGRNFQNRYQDYRAFSEAMRVQLAWNSIGLTHESVDVAYLKIYQSELEWIRMAIRAANLIFTIDTRYAGNFAPDGYVKWVDEQTTFLRKAVNHDLYRLGLCRKIGLFVFVACIAVGIIPFAIAALAGMSHWPLVPHSLSALAEEFSNTLAGAIHSLIPTVTAGNVQAFSRFGAGAITFGVVVRTLLVGYAEQRHFEANVKRYARILSLFLDGQRRLHDITVGKPGDAKEVVRQLGREALVEHADWLLARRDRPLAVVQG